ncbi:MAG: hypothetical protein ACYC35_19265 [Pirellulales bacterium]
MPTPKPHRRSCPNVTGLFVLFFALSLPGQIRPAVAGGWSWALPPDLVKIDSGRRNHVFYVGDPVSFKLAGSVATRYQVRDYWGEEVDRGPAGAEIKLNVRQPGWYKLYLYGNAKREPWGEICGGTTFVVFRKSAGFPDMPGKETPGGQHPALDEVARGVIGMGPQRHQADASKPEETIKRLESDIAIDKKFYLPYDPLRGRVLLVAFANGTKNLDGVRKIVERFKNDVQYWEPRNEPNYGSNGADFVTKELKPFYETVKGVDPKLKVLGPGTVSVGPGLLVWIEDFLKAGGAKYLDGFSFHAYNNVNGDLWLARRSLDSLGALLAKYGADKLPKWQTEQGFFAAVYGAYQPRLQGRWTMLEMMVFEQYGIPKEHNHLWYDKSHGFWDFPTWWENEDGGFNPAAPLMRVWSEELFGARFVRAFDFGEAGNRLYLGSLFEGPAKRVAAFQSAGSPDGRIELEVTGGDKLHVVTAFGVERDLPVAQGHAELPVPELPVYVELAAGQDLRVARPDYGPNLALAAGVTAASSGQAEHPVDRQIPNDIRKIINGELENWYWLQKKEAQPWMSNLKEFPGWVEIRLPKEAIVARVLVYAAPPWQWQGSLLDYELQYDKSGQWVTLERIQEPAKVFKVFSPATRTTVDSFYSDRWVFQHSFRPVTTAKLRLVVHETTWGGGAAKDVADAGGQTGPHQIMLREIEVYGK